MIKKLSIVIPVYNEQDTLLTIIGLIDSINLYPILKEIVIVDDASTDNTVQVIKDNLVSRADITCIFQSENQGKGAALRTGFANTTGDYVIVQDADLEYNPSDYLKLINTLVGKKIDVVYGSRFSGNYKDMSGLHYIGNKFLTILTNLLYGVTLTDMETCYKLIPGDFARSIDIKSNRFNFEPEVTAKILKSGLKISETPISYAGRSHSEGKKITWRDGFSAVLTLIRFRFFN